MGNINNKRNRIKRLFNQQNGLCWICECQMIYPDHTKKPNKFTATIDHIIPVSLGGKFSDGAKAAHHWCNSARGNEDPKPKCIKSMQTRIKNLIKNKSINFEAPKSFMRLPCEAEVDGSNPFNGTSLTCADKLMPDLPL